jgi:hypothetical protein
MIDKNPARAGSPVEARASTVGRGARVGPAAPPTVSKEELGYSAATATGFSIGTPIRLPYSVQLPS